MYFDDHNYVTLKNDILQSLDNRPEIIQRLKRLYENEINSNRSSSKICNIQDLISILEKRDFLNENNIDNLIKIKYLLEKEYARLNANGRNLQGSTWNVLPSDNMRISRSVPRINSSSNYTASTSENSFYQTSNIKINPSGYETLKAKVYETIATEIGKKWMNFGRILKVKEHTLDEYASRYSRTEDRVYKILDFHEKDCDPRYWKSILLDGLVQARRQDLKQKVQDIFDMYNT